MTVLSASDLALVRTQPQQTTLWLSIYQPRIIMSCQVNDGSIAKGARTITYNNVTAGVYTQVFANCVMLVGTTPGASDVGKVRVRSASSTQFIVAENATINWQNALFLTIINYIDVEAIYPRIINDPSNPVNVIFYKDYDIPYTNQNSVNGTLMCAGPHRAAFREGASAQLYWSSSGTFNVNGSGLSFSWFFEGGTPTGSTLRDPGYIQYNTPGHYKTVLTVSGTNGEVDNAYRFVSIYDRPGVSANDPPILKWEISELSGNRKEGGYTAKIRIRDSVAPVYDGALVVIFSDDWYGGTKKSIGGNAENCSSIRFVGYIMKGTITHNYYDGYVEFQVGSVSQVMKDAEGFAIDVESKVVPLTWYHMQNQTITKALYHYLRWHSTVINIADFQFTGLDLPHQYFDTNRESLYDALYNFLKTGIVGELVADAQGKLWAEVSADATHNARTAFPNVMSMQNTDWIGSPQFDETQYPILSYIEMGGIAYSGPATGTFSALLACAPGQAPAYKGKVENSEGLILIDQNGLNNLVGDIFAYRNSRYPVMTFPLRGNYENIDIAPLQTIQVNMAAGDTPLGVALTNEPFHPTEVRWAYDSAEQVLLSTVVMAQLQNGVAGDTIIIPVDATAGGLTSGFKVPGLKIPALPTFTFPSGFANATGSSCCDQLNGMSQAYYLQVGDVNVPHSAIRPDYQWKFIKNPSGMYDPKTGIITILATGTFTCQITVVATSHAQDGCTDGTDNEIHWQAYAAGGGPKGGLIEVWSAAWSNIWGSGGPTGCRCPDASALGIWPRHQAR